MSTRCACAPRRGLTLVELVVAAGLLAFLLAAIFKLLDEFMTLWQKSEERRAIAEEASGVSELLAADLDTVEPGPRGDLLAEWVFFDVDGDSIPETKWPRVRLVRHASPGELARLQASEAVREPSAYKVRGAHAPGSASVAVFGGTERFRRGDRVSFGSDARKYTVAAETDELAEEILVTPPLQAALAGNEPIEHVASGDKLAGEGLIEAIWAVLPTNPGTRDPARRAEGTLWRGERIYGPARGADVSFFDPKYISAGGAPRPGSTSEVSSNVLWLGLAFATQTSRLDGEWKLGRELEDCWPSWDAWQRGRANADRHEWNEPPAGMPAAKDRPLLPRRVRLELELERDTDLKHRTRVARFVAKGDASIEVEDGRKLPRSGGAMLLVDAEWMELTSVAGDTASVRRGRRGTQPAPHEPGALLHWGQTFVREVPIVLHQEDWDL